MIKFEFRYEYTGFLNYCKTIVQIWFVHETLEISHVTPFKSGFDQTSIIINPKSE